MNVRAIAVWMALGTVLSVCGGTVLDDVRLADERADAAVAAIRDASELRAKQSEWRAKWLAGIGGLPAERTPLNAKEGPVVRHDGFTLQNVLFESLPGVYVVGHLFLPDSPGFKPPYPVVMLPLGHSDVGIVAPRYAALAVGLAKAGFAAFSWDPLSQGERRQCAKEFDGGYSQCATEHAQLGARGRLVGWNFTRFRIWDALRAVDYVESRGDLDCSRIGVCGNSGGGTMSAYMQALDDRVKVAFPNCFVSSIREVFRKRGGQDSEQFYWNQLHDGVNHAAMLAMGLGRVSLTTGSRYGDYFSHNGAVSTFSVYSNLYSRLSSNLQPSTSTLQPSTFNLQPPHHFHCAGPHGLPAPTRAAMIDWMDCCIRGGAAPKPIAEYWKLSTGDHERSDPANLAPLPFPAAESRVAKGFVRDLPGFKSLFTLFAERADELAKARAQKPRTREELREIVRRRAGIVKGSGLNTDMIALLNALKLPTMALAPVSGFLLAGATASTTAGASIAAQTFSGDACFGGGAVARFRGDDPRRRDHPRFPAPRQLLPRHRRRGRDVRKGPP